VAELEKFLPVEFPQVLSNGGIGIESADGVSCLLLQRYRCCAQAVRSPDSR